MKSQQEDTLAQVQGCLRKLEPSKETLGYNIGGAEVSHEALVADISDKFIRGLDLCNLLLEFQDIFSRGPHDLGGQELRNTTSTLARLPLYVNTLADWHLHSARRHSKLLRRCMHKA